MNYYAEIVRIVGRPTGRFCCIFTGKMNSVRITENVGKSLDGWDIASNAAGGLERSQSAS